MKPTHIEHIGIAVNDLKEAIPFFEEKADLNRIKDPVKLNSFIFCDWFIRKEIRRVKLWGSHGTFLYRRRLAFVTIFMEKSPNAELSRSILGHLPKIARQKSIWKSPPNFPT